MFVGIGVSPLARIRSISLELFPVYELTQEMRFSSIDELDAR